MTEGVIVAFITGVLGPLIILYVRKVLERRKKDTVVEDTLAFSETIITKLEHIKEEYGADRVWISQFHNGGNFYPTGKSMAKFSILYEVVELNITSVQMNFQNIPVNLFSRSINELLQNDVIAISDYKDDEVATFGLKYVAENFNCKSTYFFSIKSIDEKFIGILCVDYVKKKTILDSMALYELQIHSASLGGVIMESLKKK